MKKLLLAVFAVLTAAALFAQDAATAANEKVENVTAITTIANPKGTKLFVVGDSTVSAFNDPYYYPRYGYGTKLQDYLLPKKVEVINLAMSGRSSKSFTTEANYETLKTYLKKGDYLLIGFGHNDEKAEAERYTNPNGSKEEAGSFKNSLYENYIKLAQEKGATPILCTPIVRRAPGKAYEGSVVHVTNDQGANFPGGDYPKAIRELGAETGVIVVDLTEKTKALYESLGDDGTQKLHAWISHKDRSVDNTHLNNYGATVVAQIVVQDAAAQNKKFAKLVNKKAREPNEALDLVKNPAYTVPSYEPFKPAEDVSLIHKTTAPWYGTVFGDTGGESKIADPNSYEITEIKGGVAMHAGPKDASKQVGKIAIAQDGFAFYFQQLPANKNFTFTATAKVVAIAKNNQVAFGLMARDDVYIDKYDNTVNANYVVAGPINIADGAEFNSSFQRADGALAKNHNAGGTLPDAGVTVNLSIKKNGNTYIVKYGNEPEVSYTANLTEKDKDFIYVGTFVARAANVEFTNIKLNVQ